MEILGCVDNSDLWATKMTRFAQPTGAYELRFKQKEVFFCIDGEPFLLKNVEKIAVRPKILSKNPDLEKCSSIIIVRGPNPHLTYQ